MAEQSILLCMMFSLQSTVLYNHGAFEDNLSLWTTLHNITGKIFVFCIATDVILRNVELQTEMGVRCAQILYRGEAIPEEMVFKMIGDKINSPECAHYGKFITFLQQDRNIFRAQFNAGTLLYFLVTILSLKLSKTNTIITYSQKIVLVLI